MRRVSAAHAPLALDQRHQLVRLVEQAADQQAGAHDDVVGHGHHAVARHADEVTLVHLAGVGGGVPHRPGHLGRHHVDGRAGHGGHVGRRVRRGIVGQEGGEALDHGARGHHPHGLVAQGVDLFGHRADVPVVGQDDHLVRGHGLDRLDQIGGGRVHGLATHHEVVHPEGPEDAPDPLSGDHGDDAGGRRRASTLDAGPRPRRPGTLAHPALLLELLVEVGHPDTRRPAGVHPRLDGGADVVGVDVAVPQAIPAYDDDGVADARPDLLEVLHGVVGGMQEVHHLVAQVADRAGVAGPGVGGVRPTGASWVGGRHSGGLWQRAAVQHEQERIEEEEETGASGVDHAGLGQHRQHLGRAGQRLGRPDPGRLDHAHQPVSPSDATRRPVGGGAGHGEDGALHRAHHGPPGQLGRVRERLDQQRGSDAARAGAWAAVGRGHALAHAAQQLGEDHARVAPGAHERTVADGLADVGQRGLTLDRVELAHHGLEGERHVGARVAVGHGVDVQAVDVRLVEAERISVARHHGAQLARAQRHGLDGRRGGHQWGC